MEEVGDMAREMLRRSAYAVLEKPLDMPRLLRMLDEIRTAKWGDKCDLPSR
jgi:DNA-binding NtrC family response regulator